jgi:threonine dehydrogenase-like Zn-dependent dehydrogenase
MAIQLAKAVSEARIIVMDIEDNKLQTAKNNSADIAVSSKNEDAAVKSVREITDGIGADAVVIDFVVIASKTAEIDVYSCSEGEEKLFLLDFLVTN